MTEDRVAVVISALRLARGRRFDEIPELFTEQLRPLVAPEALRSGWDAELSRRGEIAELGDPVVESAANGAAVVKLPVRCERGGFTLVAIVGPDLQLAGLQLAGPEAAAPIAPWEPPDYVRVGSFDEQELTLGSGPLAVGATISVPHGPGPWPAVVLMAGSGPLDRDETIGRNKPLKDVAWGLASRGVAVLRFDKVTYAHADRVTANPTFTVSDEYLPDALAAVNALQESPSIDPGRVYLLGHSLGGTVAPRVAAADETIAGLILMAAGAQPLHWVIVRQTRYLASLNPATQAAAAPAIQALIKQAELVDSRKLSRKTPSNALPLGAPAPYWLDLRGYDPAAVAATLDRPILILQGGRDYQATVEDDLVLWQSALAGRPDVTVRVYPAHNHLFTPGEGPCTPAEYEPAQHVDRAVVADIADWLARPR